MTTAQEREQVLISFDIDGTMEFGDPPGPIAAQIVVALAERGFIVGCASDHAVSGQEALWLRHGVQPSFVGGKHHLHEVRERFAADRYLHIGDTDIDQQYAVRAGFEFLSVYESIEPALDQLLELGDQA